MRCPNCNYLLILREYRGQYKCPKCRRVFPQKELELRKFLITNKKERGKDREELEKEIEAKIKRLIEEDSIRLAFSSITRECNKRQSALFDRVLDRDKYNQKKCEYWARQKNHLNEKRRENYQKQKPKILAKQALYRQNNKILRQLNNFRTQQKVLALKMINDGVFNQFIADFQRDLPTFTIDSNSSCPLLNMSLYCSNPKPLKSLLV